MSIRKPHPFAARAALAYVAVAALWIVASDHVLVALVGADRAAGLQTWKGGLFVAFTAIALYLLLRHEALRADAPQPLVSGAYLRAPRTLLLTLGALALLGAAVAFLAWHALARDLAGGHPTPTVRLLALALGATFIASTALVLGLTLRVERAERRSLGARLDHLARYARDGVVLLSADRTIVDANERAAEIFARPPDWFAGRGLDALCALPGGEVLDECWRNASSASGTLFEAQAVRGDGSRLAVEISARPVQLRERQYVQLLVRDVSERQRARAALAESETRLRLALEASRQGLYDYDVRSGSVIVNAEYARMLGHDPATFAESEAGWRERLHPDDRERATRALEEYLDGVRDSYRTEFRLRTASSDWLWVLSTGAIVEREADGRPRRMLGTHIDISARVRAEMALREERERLSRILEGTRAGTWEWNVVTGEVLVNERWAQICGYTPDELAPIDISTWERLAHPDDLARSGALLQRHFAGEEPYYECEARMRHRDGHWVWIQDRGRVFEHTPDGRPLWMAGTHIDITATKLAEEDLRASEARFRELFESNPHPMWVYDVETLAFLAVNDAAVGHYGWSREEFLGMTILAIRPAEDVEKLLAYMRRPVGDFDDAGVWRHRTRDGRVIEVEVSAHALRYSGRRAELVLAHDVTARNAALRALETEERKFRTLAEQSLVGIYIVEDGRVAYANPRAAEIFGYGAQDVIGVAFESLVDPGSWPQVEPILRASLAGDDTPVRYEFRGRRRDGGGIMVGIHGGVAVLDGRRVLIGVLQDITDRVATERQLHDYVQRLERAVLGTVDAISEMVELRDPYTAGHERRVGELAAAIAAEMGLAEDVQRGLRIAGGVHDVGKITIPAEILVKPTRLTPIEFELVKTHAAQGYEILKNVEFPWPVAEVARQHHERLDGSGYPRGLAGDAILPEARIIAVADVVESMASHRPYRPTLGIDAALAEIESRRGQWYEPAVVDACLRLFRERGYTLAAR